MIDPKHPRLSIVRQCELVAIKLMRKMGLTPIYQKLRTSVPHPERRIYPYLLRDVPIDRPDHVWCADGTYIR